jgi:hypothetical protein
VSNLGASLAAFCGCRHADVRRAGSFQLNERVGSVHEEGVCHLDKCKHSLGVEEPGSFSLSDMQGFEDRSIARYLETQQAGSLRWT